MTRLTDEQVAKLWAETEAPHIRTFADRIAALAVQEVERKLCDEERNANRWCGKAMVAEGKLTESQREVATLTAQLATAKRGVRDVAMSVALAVANDFLRVNHRYPPNWIGTENHANNAVEKHFPATPSGELCDADCGCPSPEAREVRLKVYLQDGEVRGGRRVMRFEGQPLYVEFTPADAKRIGILGGWRDA